MKNESAKNDFETLLILQEGQDAENILAVKNHKGNTD